MMNTLRPLRPFPSASPGSEDSRRLARFFGREDENLCRPLAEGEGDPLGDLTPNGLRCAACGQELVVLEETLGVSFVHPGSRTLRFRMGELDLPWELGA